jgi:putative tryptophan/tyrosine transport system substrate-binding protein
MRRRDIIALLGGAVTWPHVVRAQTTPTIGFLNGAAAELTGHYVRPFLAGLAEMGYVDGQNIHIEYRWANGRYDQLPALAVDLVRHQVAAIAATSTPAGLPANAATQTIPIVFVTGSDPIEQGLVTNLHRPEGNITGFSTLAVELGRKRMELMREVIPAPDLMGILINPVGPNLRSVSEDLLSAARDLKQQIHIVHASTEREIDAAFDTLSQLRASALLIGTDTFFNSQGEKLAALSLRHKLPAIYQYREFVAAGGLMSYAGSITDAYHMAGVYVGRVLKGEKVSDLPAQRSTKAELFVNLKTAEGFGLTIPPSILARAHEVIE